MGEWVRAGRWDVCLCDVGAVKRLPDGGASVFLRGVTEVGLDPIEASVFLPRFSRYARLDGPDPDEGLDAGGLVAIDDDSGGPE